MNYAHPVQQVSQFEFTTNENVLVARFQLSEPFLNMFSWFVSTSGVVTEVKKDVLLLKAKNI